LKKHTALVRCLSLGISFLALIWFGLCPVGVAQTREEATKDSLDRFLRNYLESDKHNKSYIPAFVDLRDEGTKEVVVYVTDADWCGSGGCTTLILAPEGSSYRLVTKITIVRLPIRILATKTNGWHDLGVWVQGGGIEPAYEAKLSFDGQTYPSNPSMAPRLTRQTEGTVLVSSAIVEKLTKREAKPSAVETIAPGQSVGNLQLGMTLSDLERPVFSWQPKAQISRNENDCRYRSVSWVNIEGNYPVVSAYLGSEGVVEIDVGVELEVQGMGFVYGKKLSELRSTMPAGKLYRWKGSGWRMPGGRDELFWVVEDKGIAFGLDYDRKSKSLTVFSVAIFKPQERFQPEGCLRNPEELVPVESNER
jgi:hypothetical protein